MGAGSFLHQDCRVYYIVQRADKGGYGAKGYILLQDKNPSGYVPVKLDRVYLAAEEAKEHIIAFCKNFIDENLVEIKEQIT
jgi:hypothetical protein